MREKFTSLNVLTLCFNEKLPAAGNLALYSEGNDIKWHGQGFPPQIQRPCLTTVWHHLVWENYYGTFCFKLSKHLGLACGFHCTYFQMAMKISSLLEEKYYYKQHWKPYIFEMGFKIDQVCRIWDWRVYIKYWVSTLWPSIDLLHDDTFTVVKYPPKPNPTLFFAYFIYVMFVPQSIPNGHHLTPRPCTKNPEHVL